MIVLSTLYQTPRKSQAGGLRNIQVQASQVCHPPVLLRSRLHPPAARSAHRHKWDAVVLLVEVPNIWQPSGQVKRVPGPRSILTDKSHWSHPYALCDKAFTNVQCFTNQKKLGDIPVPAVRLGGLIFSWLSKGLGDVTPPHLSSLVSSCMFLLKRSIHVQHLWFDQMSLETLFWSAVRCTFAT